MYIVKKTTNFNEIESDYLKLYSEGIGQHFFQNISVHKAADNIYYKYRWKSKIIYYIVYKDSEAIMLFPFRSETSDTLIIMGGREKFDYCDAIVGINETLIIQEGLKALFSYLLKEGIRYLHLCYIDPKSILYSILKDNYEFENEEFFDNVSINIKYDSFDEYYHTLSKHTRQNLRTALNRIEKNGHCIKHSLYYGDKDSEIMKKIAPEYFNLYLDRQKKKYSDNPMKHVLYLSLFDYLKNSFSGVDCIFSEIRIDDKLAACLQGGIDSSGKRFEIPRLAINDEFNSFSPGMLLVEKTIEKMISHKEIEIFDLCRGNEGYKTKMGGCLYNTSSFYVKF